MNFSTAIQAHSDWKLRLTGYCRGTLQEAIDLRELGKDNVCELGKWINGEGRSHAPDSKFGELVLAHAAFHRSAAAVATMIAQGKRAEAETLMNSHESEFGKCSRSVVGLLMRFRDRYGNS